MTARCLDVLDDDHDHHGADDHHDHADDHHDDHDDDDHDDDDPDDDHHDDAGPQHDHRTDQHLEQRRNGNYNAIARVRIRHNQTSAAINGATVTIRMVDDNGRSNTRREHGLRRPLHGHLERRTAGARSPRP